MKHRFISGKKGLGAGQVFVYIVAALTFALIMIFGYKIINDLIHTGEDVQFLQFKTSLETSIKKIYPEFGSVREETFYLPGRYTQICFVDVTKQFDPDLCAYDAAACNFWKTMDTPNYDLAAENVFLTPAAAQQIKVFTIDVSPAHPGEDGFLCLPISQGTFTIRLEGKGDRTGIALPQP